ncbi:Flp pilus assembly protein TadG [Nitrobacteraceae bacterium AZCC 2146]
MPIRTISAQARKTLARFARAERGNIAATFAIVLVPLLAFVGAAVDYSRAYNARTSMQGALDSAALMVSKDLASGIIKQSDVSAKAQSYFNALYTNKEATGVTIDATYAKDSQGASTILVNGTGSLPTQFMKVIGMPTLGFNTSSTATWGTTRLRVAMALDVTGSMDDNGKLPAMKTAAKQLIDTLKASATSTADVYISIIPFNQMVNVGTGNKGASWLDWDTDYGSCNKSTYTTKSACVAAGKNWTANNVSNWQGCVTDRDKTANYDTLKDAPTTATPGTLFLAKKYTDCSSSILPMKSAYDSNESDSSTDDTTLKGKINNFVANGNTNQAIGMHWAWMSLQATDPLNTPAKDADYKYNDVIILMSDGMNTQDRWYTTASQIDARQKLLCDNIKNPLYGTTSVYTIQVNTSGDPESTVLKGCANSGQFFPTTTVTEMAAAFSSIGSSLTKLRVAK